MNAQPLVSIIIPVFNGSNFMREAIDSALAQTYPNVEVIVVNDGSTDDSAMIANSYGGRIRYFSQANGGVAAALNTGIEHMRGEYFSWLSHDDLYTGDKIEMQVQRLSTLADRQTIIWCNYDLIDATGRTTNHFRARDDYALEKLKLPLFPLSRAMLHGCGLLIHRDLFERFGRFDQRLLTTQDYDLWFRMLRSTPIDFLDLALVKGRQHPQQASRSLRMIDEGNAFWRKFADEVTEDEAATLEGSRYAFLSRLADFLATTTPFSEAERHARAKAAELPEAVAAPVVMPMRPGALVRDFLRRLTRSR